MGGHCEPLFPSPSSPSSSSSSSSSSRDSFSHTALSTTSSLLIRQRQDFSTDLKLGLSLSASSLQDHLPREREQYITHWPPIKTRSTPLEGKVHQGSPRRFFVKVYMEGVPIGRKLDLFAHNGYDDLVKTLGCMFSVTITCPDLSQVPSGKTHVLTYEDIEGDWMMVGDVPWEFFLATVKKLKITGSDKC